MRYSRVLFYIPPFPGIQEYPGEPHTGIGYLSEFLSRNNVENDVLDLRMGYSVKELMKKIHDYQPDLVASTMMTFRHDIAYDLIEQIGSPHYDILVGGPHVSTLRTAVLEECGADFAIKLEGEYPLLELCNGQDLASIDGLIYRENGRISENKDRPFITELDDIPFPTYEKFEMKKYNTRQIPLVSSRGCPYKCVYCPIKVTMGRKMRMRSPENVIQEIEYWYGRGYKKFVFADDNFAFNKERVYRICELLTELNHDNLVLKCPNGVRADTMDRDLLQTMKEAGFTQLSFGVEAGNDRVLRSIKKGETIEIMERAIKGACELGYDVTLFFLVGSPGETPADVEDSVALALKYPLYEAMFYNLIPFPGTELFDWVRENGYFLSQPEEYLNNASHWGNEPVFETPEFPAEERKRVLLATKKVRKAIKRKSYERKFMKLKTGFLSRVGAKFMTSDSVDGLLSRSKYFGRTIRFLAEKSNIWH
jgi:anaerobic magnesium-protoporphyrin IX monomethyl ester cyclase